VKRLNFAIIGAGNIAPVHAAAIREIPDAKLTAIATRDPQRGQAFAAEHGAEWHADYREVLARPEVDVVAIASPHNLHLPMTVDAAAAGKHVLCEKPMARTVAECDEMIDACDRAGVLLGVTFQGRFEPLVTDLRDLLSHGRIGQLLWASSNTVWYRDTAYYRSKPWRGTWAEEGGGVLINQAIHAIDLLVWVAGLPTRLTAQTRTLNHEIEVEDGAVAMLEYADGAMGLIQATTVAYPGYSERLEFYGTQGGVVYHKGEGCLEWHLLDPKEDGEKRTAASSGATRPMDISADAHAALFGDFAAAIRTGSRPLIDGREGRRSLELVEAIYRSSRSGEPVAVSGIAK
jgi:UDP-N-acetyl-2-amino-2-deoxyglucuronate dehydrogenase